MEGTRKQVHIEEHGGTQSSPKPEHERESEGMKAGKGGEQRHKEGEHRITKVIRPMGITSIRNVDIINRQYISPGVHMYIKNREGVYQNTDVSRFLNNADIKLTFTLPYDIDPNDLVFSHQKSACPVTNPLVRSQCAVRVGLLESVDTVPQARPLAQGQTRKAYTIELPIVRGLHLEPFQTLHYSIRVAGLKMPEQTDLFWRIHLKVCQADDLVEVVSISDTPFDVNVLQDNIQTISDRFGDMVVTPIKRRGLLGWFKRSKEGQQQRSSTPSSTSSEQHPQEKQEESASLRV